MAVGIQSAANVADFKFRVVGFDAGMLRVTAFEGIEALSELFEFRLRLVSERGDLDPEVMLGKPADFEIAGPDGARVLHAMIRRFERVGSGTSLAHYEADLVPPHWLLTKRIQSRVFSETRHDLTDVVEIVKKVLSTAGFTDEDLRVATVLRYEPREFTVQYRESDWNFISRLLEAEGVYYFFEHDDSRCRLALVDSKVVHSPFSAEGFEVPFREARNLLAEREFVYAARRGRRVQTGAVSLDDFDFRFPGRELRLERSAGQFTGVGWADYPGGYVDTARGRRLVQTRLEEQQCQVDVSSFTGTVRGFWCGSRFRLVDHPDARFNADYLITRVLHRGTQSQSGDAESVGGLGTRYESEIAAIPADVQFRPPRVTPRPTVHGSQTAIVVGPPGEEIYTDEYGRVEVRFHWDQEAKFDAGASCWIRVSQGWAGGQYGMMFLPRVGQEVIVDFLEGDPDQPIITGRVYNRDHMPPYTLPDKRTISTIRTCSSPGAGGGNEIRFDDAKGCEQLLLFAQGSMHQRARGSRYESVGGDAHSTVAGDAFELVKKNRHSIVTLDLKEEIKGSKHQLVQGDVKEYCFGKQTAFVSGRYTVLNSGGICLATDGDITLVSNGNFIKIDKSGVTIKGTMVNINSGGAIEGPLPDGPQSPDEPQPAATTEFGHNTRYDTKPDELKPLDAQAAAGESGDSSDERATSWIEIELIDELNQPVPFEPYKIKLPDGKVKKGTLDKLGRAHVALAQPELCEVTFPKLDAAAWERVG